MAACQGSQEEADFLGASLPSNPGLKLEWFLGSQRLEKPGLISPHTPTPDSLLPKNPTPTQKPPCSPPPPHLPRKALRKLAYPCVLSKLRVDFTFLVNNAPMEMCVEAKRRHVHGNDTTQWCLHACGSKMGTPNGLPW